MSSNRSASLRLPESLRTEIAPARQLAREDGIRLFLVCGAVRDVLLHRAVTDVDLAVEGDAIDFARRVAKAVGGRLTAHERFGTAKLALPSGGRLDFAATRTEIYDAPAALPRVSPASIEEDLARRDFTINALALQVAPDPRMRLLDPFGGRRDLARGIVRMLHPRSAVDDPTRAFRAVRFANRFRFAIDPRTVSWIRAAVSSGVVDRLSGDRLRREIERIFSEPRPAAALGLMGRLGLTAVLSPVLTADRAARSRLARAEKLARARPGRTSWFALFLAWTAGLDDAAAASLAVRLALDRERAALLSGWPAARAAAAQDAGAAEKLSADELLAAASATEDPGIRRRLEHLLDAPPIALSIGGRDLVREGIRPGPAIGRALARTLEARRAGQISSEHELAYALAEARQGRP